MKVHLLKTPEYSNDSFVEVGNFLNSFEGPIEFELSYFDFPPSKFPFLEPRVISYLIKEPVTKYNPPEVQSENEEVLKWGELFSLCKYFREKKNIGINDFVILLTERLNEWNWFSHFDDDKNIFIHTKHWQYYTEAHHKNPVSYQITENILQYLMEIGTSVANNPFIHIRPIGCMNDFCQDKSEIMIKMRTADICTTCLERIKAKQISSRIISQIRNIFKGVCDELRFINQLENVSSPVELQLTDTNKLILPEFDSIEIRLTPLFKTLYIFFLTKPEGVKFVELSDFRSDILKIYKKIRPGASTEDAAQRVADLISPMENNFNSTKSHINRIITQLLGEDLAKFYRIEGGRGGLFKVNLPTNLVDIRY